MSVCLVNLLGQRGDWEEYTEDGLGLSGRVQQGTHRPLPRRAWPFLSAPASVRMFAVSLPGLVSHIPLLEITNKLRLDILATLPVNLTCGFMVYQPRHAETP